MAEQTKTPSKAEGVVKPSQAVPLKDVTAGTAARMHVLIGPDDGAPHFAMRRFVMEAGGGMPAHTNQVEHEQYVLRGRAEVGIGGNVHQVRAGDVLYIPAGSPHYYKVLEGPFEFLCMVPNAPDKIDIVPDGC